VHFSYGRNIGRAECSIPDLGFKWHPTLQPLVLSLWPLAPHVPAGAPYTTVIKWRPYGPLEFRGRTYGLKDLEFRKFVDLPSLVPVSLELASEGKPPIPRETLAQKGWIIREAWDASDSLLAYRDYIHASRGEWSVAKNIYVDTRSGWFSERSAVYLASGKPVVAQSTGYETWLPTGQGLFSFSTVDDVLAGFDAVESDYTRHSSAARSLAEAYFRADVVLSSLVETALRAPTPVVLPDSRRHPSRPGET
jgi:hypothetical protein